MYQGYHVLIMDNKIETPDWTEKDRKMYRQAKENIESGKSVLKRIE